VDEIKELINRRRRQILVHSIIYYSFDENIISDSQWSKWAEELVKLQQQYPEIARDCVYADAYENFDGSSGFNLPLNDPGAFNTAVRLLNWRNPK
jgi:hypothetical protein